MIGMQCFAFGVDAFVNVLDFEELNGGGKEMQCLSYIIGTF